LNLDTDPSYFQIINPCGFAPDSVTSLSLLLNHEVVKATAFYRLTNAIEAVFSADLKL
jgi:lipoate-protein ligase B